MTQQEKLHRAIDLAEGPGECRYTQFGQYDTPCCIVGQLAYLDNERDFRVLAESDQDADTRGGSTTGITGIVEEADVLPTYSVRLLQELQTIWDLGLDGYEDSTPEERREAMHDAVERYYAGHPEHLTPQS